MEDVIVKVPCSLRPKDLGSGAIIMRSRFAPLLVCPEFTCYWFASTTSEDCSWHTSRTLSTIIDIRTYVCSNVYATTRRKKRQARTWPWVLGLHILE